MSYENEKMKIEILEEQSPSAFDRMWDEYERVVLQSILTSFGLDFLVHDQRGGDVDTIHGVQESNTFRNQFYRQQYENRGDYNAAEYHGRSPEYIDARNPFKQATLQATDSYDPSRTLYFNKEAGPWNRAALDHVIAAKKIHDDPLRVMAGLDGATLANNQNNLRYTSMSLNSKMKDMTMDEFFQWCDEHPDKVKWNGQPGATIPADVRSRMKAEEDNAKKYYISTISDTYYSNTQFYLDSFKAAGKRGVEMGVRQAIGFIFIEIWFACKKELQEVPVDSDFGDFLKAITRGIPKGLENAKLKYDVLLSQFEQGFIAGVIANLTTTLCNVFFTTEKNTVKYIRFAYTAVVQAGTVILINPDDLPLGDQMRVSVAMLANGAATIAGAVVGDTFEKVASGLEPTIGNAIQRFISVLVSGLLSCTLLMLLDSSKFINDLIIKMNVYVSEGRSIKELAKAFEQEAAYLGRYDIKSFREEADKYARISSRLLHANDEDELHDVLISAFSQFEISSPWDGDFDSFMNDDSRSLVFD